MLTGAAYDSHVRRLEVPMRRFINWLGRVPAWVWLLLACTQVLNIFARSSEIIGLRRDIPRLPEHEAWDEIREKFQQMLCNDELQLVASIIALLAFAAFAIARIMNSRAHHSVAQP
jgi:hypothetical protein